MQYWFLRWSYCQILASCTGLTLKINVNIEMSLIPIFYPRTEPELAFSWNLPWLPVEGLGPKVSHVHFDIQFSLPIRCARVKVAQKLWKWPTTDWSILKLMCWEGSYHSHCLEGKETNARQPRKLGKNKTRIYVGCPSVCYKYAMLLWVDKQSWFDQCSRRM